MLGSVAMRAFKLAKKFGGDPETYREFVEKNIDKDFREIFTLYSTEHNLQDQKKELTE